MRWSCGCCPIRRNIIHRERRPNDGRRRVSVPDISAKTGRALQEHQTCCPRPRSPPASGQPGGRGESHCRSAHDCYEALSKTASLLYLPVVEAILSMGVRLRSLRHSTDVSHGIHYDYVGKQSSVPLFRVWVSALLLLVVTLSDLDTLSATLPSDWKILEGPWKQSDTVD